METHHLGKAAAVEEGRGVTFSVGSKRIIVMRFEGKLTAYRNFCPHMGGTVRFNGCDLVCMMHGSQFDPRTGEPRTAPATESGPLEPITLRVEGDELYAEIEPPKKSPWADDF